MAFIKKFQQGGQVAPVEAAPAQGGQNQMMAQLEQMAMEIIQSVGPEGAAMPRSHGSSAPLFHKLQHHRVGEASLFDLRRWYFWFVCRSKAPFYTSCRAACGARA